MINAAVHLAEHSFGKNAADVLKHYKDAYAAIVSAFNDHHRIS